MGCIFDHDPNTKQNSKTGVPSPRSLIMGPSKDVRGGRPNANTCRQRDVSSKLFTHI